MTKQGEFAEMQIRLFILQSNKYHAKISLWQRKQLLAIINERTGHNFSYETLERRDESMFARKKKK